LIRKRLSLIAAILGIFIAIFGAYQMIGRIRIVDIITLFFGGFGAGAGMIKMISDFRKEKPDSNSIPH
jgi:dolichyl-phosphate-mannose--protein O-mannosyl transferase